MPESNPLWLFRFPRLPSILTGIAVLSAASIVLVSAVQKTRIAAQRMADT